MEHYLEIMDRKLQQSSEEQTSPKQPNPTIIFEEINCTESPLPKKNKNKSKKNKKTKTTPIELLTTAEHRQKLVEQAECMQKQCEKHVPKIITPETAATAMSSTPPTLPETLTNFPKEPEIKQQQQQLPTPPKQSSKSPPNPKKIQSMILGSSIVKHVRGGYIKRNSGIYSKVCCYPGAGSEKVIDHAEVELKYALPKIAIIHCGGNDIANDLDEDDIIENVVYLGHELLHRGVKKIAISGMVPRINLKKEIPQLNRALKQMCKDEGYDFISNENIYYNWHLSDDNVHLNYEGVKILERNYTSYLRNTKVVDEE